MMSDPVAVWDRNGNKVYVPEGETVEEWEAKGFSPSDPITPEERARRKEASKARLKARYEAQQKKKAEIAAVLKAHYEKEDT
jgi:hypothetical protein